MIELNGHLICADHDESDIVRDLLPEHIRLTLEEPGCLSFSVQETNNPLVWSVSEQFSDLLAFDAHQNRVRSSRWGRDTAHIKRDYKVTEKH